MSRSRARGVGLCLLVLGAAAPLSAERIRNHFDTDAVGRPPGFFDAIVLGEPGAARWIVLSDRNPPSAPNCLAQVDAHRPADSIAVALRRNARFRDGSLFTWVKRGASRAGLVWRMADEKNFLVLLLDTQAGEAVLTSYRGGRPTVLGRGNAALEHEWEKLSVTSAGPSLSVSTGDRKLFDAADPHPVAGGTGLAAAGPGEASFDEFVIDPADAP
jgi:hypothetical protein